MRARALTIRRFRPADLDRILEIERLSFPKAPYPRDLFLELFADCGKLFLVARAGRRIAGYAVTCTHASRAELVSIAVDPAHRQTGVGKALLRRTLTALRNSGIPRLNLMVRRTNKPAIAFYRGFGFHRAGSVPRYYENGADGVRMTLRISPRAGSRPE